MMCFVSVLTQAVPNQALPPIQQWGYATATEFQVILQKLDALDKKLNLRDCHDTEKAAFLKALADRIAELEQQLGRQATTSGG